MGNSEKSKYLEKAYSDYIYTRKMMDCGGEADLRDLASAPLRFLRQRGRLDKLEDVDGHGSYAVKINVNVNGENEPWLLKSAADASIADALKSALMGRTVPYAAIRVSGKDDLPEGMNEIEEGRASEIKEEIVKAAEDFSSFAVCAGIPVGIASDIYHPAFSSSRLEAAAVMSATPAVDMRRDDFASNDLIFMVKDEGECASEDAETDAELSLKESGNSVYFKKISRLLSNGEAKRMVKDIISTDEGGFAFRLGAEYSEVFEEAAESVGLRCIEFDEGNIEITKTDTEEVNIGIGGIAHAEETIKHENPSQRSMPKDLQTGYVKKLGSEMSFSEAMRRVAEDINICSKRGLTERFDSIIGRGTVMMPLGGSNQLSPMQIMVNKIPVTRGETDDCSMMAWGGNPYIFERSPYRGGYLSVVESVSKLVAAGASFDEVYLSLYGEYGTEKAAQAMLLGAFEAEMGLGVPAISGHQVIKDDADALPVLLSFAFTMGKASEVCSPEFKAAGHNVVMLAPEVEEDGMSAYKGMPTPDSLIAVWRKAYELIANGKAVAAYTPGIGGVAEAVMKMSYGNGIGFEFSGRSSEWDDDSESRLLHDEELFGYAYGSIILEMATEEPIRSRTVTVREIGHTIEKQTIGNGKETLDIGELLMLYEGRSESYFPIHAESGITEIGNLAYSAGSWPTPIFKRANPKVLIPVFSGTIGEYDAARAAREAGGNPELLFIHSFDEYAVNESAEKFAERVEKSHIIFLPDGCSESTEDYAMATVALLKNKSVCEVVTYFLDKSDGLMAGIGEGFKALTELGLLPYGHITDEEGASILTGPLGAMQSRIVRIRVASNKSPWLRGSKPGEIYSVPFSSASGRFTASGELIRKLAVNGQIATQYVDIDGKASADIRFNPSASALAAEAVTSPDGRILGRMGHAERVAAGLYANVPGKYLSNMFENAIRYFK